MQSLELEVQTSQEAEGNENVVTTKAAHAPPFSLRRANGSARLNSYLEGVDMLTRQPDLTVHTPMSIWILEPGEEPPPGRQKLTSSGWCLARK